MKNSTAEKTNGTVFNIPNIQRTASYYRAESQQFPLWRVKLSAALCRKMRPVVKSMAAHLHITPIQARSVLLDLGFQRLAGVKAPGERASK